MWNLTKAIAATMAIVAIGTTAIVYDVDERLILTVGLGFVCLMIGAAEKHG